MKPKQKATQVIKDLDFSEDGCAVSIVGPSVGGAANNYKVLTVKAASKISDEFIKKASTVKVTMEMTEYLSKFYGLWYEEAEVLARALGYTTAEMDYVAEHPENSDSWYEDYITEKVSSIEIMKSLYQAENVADILADLTGSEYLNLLQDQAMLEKAFVKIERLNKAKESKPKGDDTSKSEVKEGKSPVIKNKTKETNMDEIVELQKSLNEQKEMLTKALEQVKALESEKQEQVVKSKTAKITEIVKDATQAQVIAKAALALDNEKDFDEFVKAVEAIAKAVDKSDLFIEKGLQVDNVESQVTESAVMKAVKARIAKSVKQ